MFRSKAMLLVILAGLAAGCVDDPVLPPADEFAPSAAVVAAGSPGLVVEFRGAAPADLQERVAALGGTVEFVSEALGFARVRDLGAEAAAALAAGEGVAAVYDDVTLQLAAEPMLGEVEMSGPEAMSIENPAGALRYSYQWNMRQIGAHTAWAAGYLGSAAVTIAILDTGIDYDGYNMNGMVDLDRSTSFVWVDDQIMAANWPTRHVVDDLNGHGTNVATQASSNGHIFAGVNSKTRLIGVKVLGYNGSGSLAGVLAGLAWAADQGADVANMSLGVRNGWSKVASGRLLGLINKAFNYAQRKGMVVVVSAGNDGANLDRDGVIFRAYCEAPHVICVSATGPTSSTNAFSGPWVAPDAGAGYSNTGRQSVSVSAPGGTTAGWVSSVCARHRLVESGGLLYLTICNQPPGYFVTTGYSGTSQASPHVAGLAAKMVEIYGPNPAQVRYAVNRAVDDLGPAGRDAVYGHGRINVAKGVGLVP